MRTPVAIFLSFLLSLVCRSSESQMIAAQLTAAVAATKRQGVAAWAELPWDQALPLLLQQPLQGDDDLRPQLLAALRARGGEAAQGLVDMLRGEAASRAMPWLELLGLDAVPALLNGVGNDQITHRYLYSGVLLDRLAASTMMPQLVQGLRAPQPLTVAYCRQRILDSGSDGLAALTRLRAGLDGNLEQDVAALIATLRSAAGDAAEPETTWLPPVAASGRELRLRHVRNYDLVIGEDAANEPGILVLQRRGERRRLLAADTVLLDDLAAPAGDAEFALARGPVRFQAVGDEPPGSLVFADDFSRHVGMLAPWRIVTGGWQTSGPPVRHFLPGRTANSFTLITAPGRRRLLAAGHWFSDQLRFSAAVRLDGPGSVGLAVQLRSRHTGVFLRWQRDDIGSGTLRLLALRDGHETVLSECREALLPGQWYRLALATDAGVLQAEVDGRTRLRATHDGFWGGAYGLEATGARAHFDDVAVHRWSAPAAAAPLALVPVGVQPIFLEDEWMRQWSGPGARWQQDSPTQLTHRARFFGPFTMTLTDAKSVHMVELLTDAGSGVTIDLSANHLTGKVQVLRDGDRLSASQGERELFSAAGAEIAAGRRLRLQLAAPAATPPESVTVVSPQVMDDRFTGAPTNWLVGGGNWGVTSRWACTPTWSFIGGDSAQVASMWAKDRVAGDFLLEGFVALRYWGDAFARGYRFHDLNVAASPTLAIADGAALVWAGWDNTASAALQGGRVTSVWRDQRLSSWTPEMHHRWFYIRLERRGDDLIYTVDGSEIGRVSVAGQAALRPGFWTWNNGIHVARAILSYAQLAAPDAPLPPTSETYPTLAPGSAP